ncbi:MAG: transcription-repair coupling factor [Oscillospiraceae bacterium]|nr:transcription-repair coupling factor [Oscillospiraceae bacterium]
MNLYSYLLENLSSFKELRDAVSFRQTPVMVTGLSGVLSAHFVFGIHQTDRILVISDDEYRAKQLCGDFNNMAGRDSGVYYPAKELNTRNIEDASSEYEQLRLSVLDRILSDKNTVVFTTPDALVQYTIAPSEYAKRTAAIKKDDSIAIKSLMELLVEAGYHRRPSIEGTAQFSVRGGIVDIFPPALTSPVRIEFWGDTVDSISFFDINTQRRTEPLSCLHITPADENGGKKATLLDYMEDTVVFINDWGAVKEKARVTSALYNEEVKNILEYGQETGEIELCENFEITRERLSEYRVIYAENFSRAYPELKPKKIISANAAANAPWSGNLKLLQEDLAAWSEFGQTSVVLAGSSRAAYALERDLINMGLPVEPRRHGIDSDVTALNPGKVMVFEGALSAGFEYSQLKFNLIAQSRQKSHLPLKRAKRVGEEIRSLSDLSVGDYVVHISHGVGIFGGINKLQVQGITKDYIKITYQGADVLYVPVTQLDLVSKYIGPKEGSIVKLNKLNSSGWSNTKARVKKAVEEMAQELIKLYAERNKVKGFEFAPDNDWQAQFEDSFEFEETDDQLRCVEEIKSDMQNRLPMDRLLCGDVGFGKTEVALRAAFKCVLDSKQCVILCPTTILAWQHYQTVTRRIGTFPIKVELLSRFRSPKQQKEIVRQLAEGSIDIIIGTHRLVQKDIVFKDLGLAIVDEEQRFGVIHKEKFKEMFRGVDMLTLSATPIPRTLNMAMSGIRDMSVISEPPEDRYPVQTYVMEHDIGILADVIKKELRRGGQVYYIHNRIESIDICASRIAEFVPEAKIGVAHGRMGEENLSSIWQKLVENEIDVLVCTTIIETGVDVSNVNTLIIEDAENMGLSQLYQLRGRVGRGNRRAYAYFTFKRDKVLSEVANKRLSSIREFTKFGSGFRIAMRDLEIRGAGNILGTSQHGHMEAVGYDMYLRLLSEAVSEKQGKEPAKTLECVVDLPIDAHIPESYIENLSTRLDIYRKIAAIDSSYAASDLIDEMIDRFGDPPPSVKGLADIALVRNKAAKHGFTEINSNGKNILLYFKEPNMEQISKLMPALKGRVMVNAGAKPYIAIRQTDNQTPLSLLSEVMDILG